MDGDLAQTHPAERAGVLVSSTDAVGGGHRVPGLVHDQHRLGAGEFAGSPGGDPVPGQIMVDGGAGQEVLQPVRPAVPQRLGQRPAVTGVQLHQHGLRHLPRHTPRLTALETVRDLVCRSPERCRPLLPGYRGFRGHLILDRLHKRS
ncbi:hypothetical protein ABIE67_010228 [Streptomyces sp. V4I8]|uniref:hypothetical protein n=1 Tax=Streptomyces sp. V4I8 TaxID=3156469 RepID=UPI003518D0B5